MDLAHWLIVAGLVGLGVDLLGWIWFLRRKW